jgi:endogenous inhibitor of DNA gyrase (YacG/DUF329 family)
MTDIKRKPEVLVLGKKCPNCRKYATLEFRPFCTKRCADVDLGRWLNEDYSIPGDEVVSNEEGVYDEDQ